MQSRLTLLLGPAGSGKTHTVLQSFEQALKTSPDLLKDDLLFILPNAEHRSRTIDLILRGGLSGFFQNRVTTFDRALKHYLKLGGFDFATDVARRSILRAVTREAKLHYFSHAAEMAGVIELLGRTIVEFKEFLLSPNELKEKLERLMEQFPEFRLKYEDLAFIYERYDAELKNLGLVDQRDSLALLEAGLTRGEFDTPKLAHVWIDGFSDFSKLQLAFIEFLTRHADQVTVTLTMDDDAFRRPLFQIAADTKTALEDLGFRAEWMKAENYRTTSEVLRHVERNLFKERPRGELSLMDPGDQTELDIFEATGLVGEIEMIVREIKRLVHTHGYHLSDIAVLFRETSAYESVLRSVFAEFQIPVEIHERLRLAKNPVSRTLASFFNILLEDWRREDVFNFLKSSYVRRNYELVSELELRALARGIFRDRTYWLDHFDTPILKDIAALEDELKPIRSVEHFARWVKKVMTHFGLLDATSSWGDAERLDEAARSRIFGLLDELQRKSGGGAPELWLRELMSLMDVDLYAFHHRDKNRVQVYNVTLARQKEYKVVFLAGLLEKKFPIQVAEDPVLSDAERRALNEQGEVLREHLPRQAFERYLFYLAVTRAKLHLILTYPRFDLEGKEALPSFYVDEVTGLFSKPVRIKRQPMAEVLPPWDEVSTEVEAKRRVVEDLFRIPMSERTNADQNRTAFFYNHFLADFDFRSLLTRRLQPIEGVIGDPAIRPYFLPEEGVYSPTAIEEYAECPYRYFANRKLHLDNQAEGIDLREVGRLLHAVLERVFTWLRDEKKGTVPFEEAKAYGLECFQREWERKPLTGDRWYRIRLKQKEMEEMLVRLLKLELVKKKSPLPDLVPRYFEYRFGFDPQNRDYLEVGSVKFRGVIDRIDVDETGKYGLVIDYKTGKKFSRKAMEQGTALQLLVYLLAAKAKLGLESLGGHLYSLSEAKSNGFHHKDHLAQLGIRPPARMLEFSSQEFCAQLEKAARDIEKHVRSIEASQIPVRPRDCVPYCPYSGVCRIEKWRLEHVYQEIREDDQKAAKQTLEGTGTWSR